MWVQRVNNIICNYLDQYKLQKNHVERVLSAKEIINDETPYYPNFLKLRLGKNQEEEEKNHVIKEGNKKLFYKIINAEKKPSKYSRIYEPKKCPSFNTEIIRYKRIKKQIENFQENIRFYNKIENVKSFYDNKENNKRNTSINNHIRIIQKSILELQPSFLFLSPQAEKNKKKKIQYTSLIKCKTKRCKSCSNRGEKTKDIFNKIKDVIRSNRQKLNHGNDGNKDINNKVNTKIFNSNNNIKKIINDKFNNKLKNIKNKNKKLKENIKKFNTLNEKNKCDINNNKEKTKLIKKKSKLKRSASEINIFS